MQRLRFRLITLGAIGALLLAACGGSDDSSDSTTTTVDGGASTASAPSDQGGDGAGGGEVDPSSITTETALVDMIGGATACGDGSLDLHRGHMPIESTLEDALGITHAEMHERMEQQDQNLAAVADDVGLGADNLVQILIEHLSPAIDSVVESGEITEEQAETYTDQLAEAVEFRVFWDGEEEPLDFCTAST